MTARTAMPVLTDKVRRARRDQLKALGVPTHVPAHQPRQHVIELLSLDMTYAMIARSAGVSDSMIRALHAGTYETLRFDRAAAVMRATHIPGPDTVWALAVGAQRRILALGLMRWSQGYIAERLGVSQQAVAGIFTWHDRRTGERRTLTAIRYERWKQIADLYDELCMKPGPFEGVVPLVRRADEAFYPLEWDGFDIDDPRITPKRSRYRREATDGDRSERDAMAAERRGRVAELTAAGLTADEIAVRLRISKRTVVRDRNRVDSKSREAAS